MLHVCLVGGCELCHGDEQRAAAVRAGQTFQCRFHHGNCSGGVEIAHIHVQPGQHRHGFADGVRDIVQLKVKEDAVSAAFDFADDGGTFCVEQLHADLDKGLASASCKAVKEREYRSGTVEVTGYDYVFFHCFILRFLKSGLFFCGEKCHRRPAGRGR